MAGEKSEAEKKADDAHRKGDMDKAYEDGKDKKKKGTPYASAMLAEVDRVRKHAMRGHYIAEEAMVAYGIITTNPDVDPDEIALDDLADLAYDEVNRRRLTCGIPNYEPNVILLTPNEFRGHVRMPREGAEEPEEHEEDSEVIDEEGEEPKTGAPPKGEEKKTGGEKTYTKDEVKKMFKEELTRRHETWQGKYEADMEAKDKEIKNYQTEIAGLKKGKPPKDMEADAIKVKADEIRKEVEEKYRKERDANAKLLAEQQKALKEADERIKAYEAKGKKRDKMFAETQKDLEAKEKKLKTYESERDEVRERLKKLSGEEKAKEPGKEPEKKEAEPEKAEEKADEEKFADATVKYGKLAHQIETKYNGRDDEEAVLARGYLEILDDLRAKGNYEAVEKGVDGFDAYLNDAMEKRAKEAEKTKTTKALKEPESMLADIQIEKREPAVTLRDYTLDELAQASGMTLDEFNAYLQAQGLSGYKDVTHVNEDGTFYRPQDQGTRDYTEGLLSGKIKMPERVSEEELLEKIAISEEPIEVKHDYTGSAKTETEDEGPYGKEPEQYDEYPVLPEAEEAEAPKVTPAEDAEPEQTYEDILVNALKGGETKGNVPKGPEEGEGKSGSDGESSILGDTSNPNTPAAPSPKIPPKAKGPKDRLIGDSVLPRKKVERQNKNIDTSAEPVKEFVEKLDEAKEEGEALGQYAGVLPGGLVSGKEGAKTFVEAIKKADEPKAEAHREEPKGDVNVKDSVLVDTTIGGEKHDDDEKLAFEEMKDIAEQNRQERAETGRLPSAGELAIEKMAETGRELTDQEAIQAAAEDGRLEREKTGRPPSIKDKALEMLAKSEDGELSNEDAMKLIKEKRREKEAEEEKKPKKKRRTFADGFTDAGKKGDN